MTNSDPYQKFQDLIFQEIKDGERFTEGIAIQDFVSHAAAKGFTIDRLIEMAESGMSGAEIWNAVNSH